MFKSHVALKANGEWMPLKPRHYLENKFKSEPTLDKVS